MDTDACSDDARSEVYDQEELVARRHGEAAVVGEAKAGAAPNSRTNSATAPFPLVALLYAAAATLAAYKLQNTFLLFIFSLTSSTNPDHAPEAPPSPSPSPDDLWSTRGNRPPAVAPRLER